VAPGDSVAVESPAYPGILDLIDLRRAHPVEPPGDGAGPIPEALAHLLRRERPAIVYLQTGVNNPTGQVIGSARRRALAEVLDDHGDAIVVEDNTLADLVFGGRSGPDLATLCRVAPVVTVESLSKVAWAGLRIGWLRAGGVVGERIARVRVANDLGASVPSQLLALQILPELDAIAGHRRSTLAASVRSATERITTHLPAWRIEPPLGSSALWAELPIPDATPYVALARRHGSGELVVGDTLEAVRPAQDVGTLDRADEDSVARQVPAVEGGDVDPVGTRGDGRRVERVGKALPLGVQGVVGLGHQQEGRLQRHGHLLYGERGDVEAGVAHRSILARPSVRRRSGGRRDRRCRSRPRRPVARIVLVVDDALLLDVLARITDDADLDALRRRSANGGITAAGGGGGGR
jgi:hypothetical protein